MVVFMDADKLLAGEDGEWEHLVHGAGAVAVAVDGGVLEARGADRGTDAAEHLAIESGVHFLGRELDAGHAAVMADAEAAQAESGECILSALDLFENFRGDAASVFDA